MVSRPGHDAGRLASRFHAGWRELVSLTLNSCLLWCPFRSPRQTSPERADGSVLGALPLQPQEAARGVATATAGGLAAQARTSNALLCRNDARTGVPR